MCLALTQNWQGTYATSDSFVQSLVIVIGLLFHHHWFVLRIEKTFSNNLLASSIPVYNSTRFLFMVFTQDWHVITFLLYFFSVRDADIAKKCGQDAIHYIKFQRYILFYVLIVTILSTAILIPVNFTGNNSKPVLQTSITLTQLFICVHVLNFHLLTWAILDHIESI